MKEQPKTRPTEKGEEKEQEARKRKLARPPKDNREVTIGPTTSTGPDITVR